MRERLSKLITDRARSNPEFIMLSGDHGYALFDEIRREKPEQFLNVGVAEQLMISLASGLAKVGYRPMVYGLSAFLPIRVLEQIKLDLCYAKVPAIILGDGAGLVYSTLGASHQCAEDLAALQSLPFLQIFTPADEHELARAFNDAFNYAGPSYIRIGKSDRPAVHTDDTRDSEAQVLNDVSSNACIVSLGSMLSLSLQLARENKLRCVGIPRIKSFPKNFESALQNSSILIVVEEHSSYGGLAAAIAHSYSEKNLRAPFIKSFALEDHFSHRCGSYQYALSEHKLSDEDLASRLGQFINAL